MKYPSAVGALLGELLGKNKGSLFATSIVAPAAWYAARAYFSTLPGPPSPIGPVVGFALLLLLALQLAAIFAYVDLSTGSMKGGFPKHVLLLPLPTWLLALVPIASGTVFIATFVLLWLRYVSGFAFGAFEQLTIATAIASLMCWVQAISWELLPSRPLGIVVLTMVVIATILSVTSLLATDADVLFGRTWGAVGLSVAIVGGFALACLAVRRARRGDTLDLGSWLRSPLKSLPVPSGNARVPAMPSATAAQDWYEWRMYGRPLPTLMLIVVVGPLASVVFEARTPSFLFPSVMLLVFFAFAPVMGASYISKLVTTRAQMGAFEATRPLSDLELGFAKLRLSIRSHLLALAILVPVIVLIIATSHHNEILAALWARLVALLGNLGACLCVGLGLLLITTLSWVWTAGFMAFQLFAQAVNQKKYAVKVSLAVVATFLVLLIGARKLYEARAGANAWLQVPHWQMFIPTLLLIAFALWLVPKFRHSSDLRALTKIIWGCAVVTGLCLLAVLPLQLAAGYKVALAAMVTAIAISTFIPSLLMPVLFDMNRHR